MRSFQFILVLLVLSFTAGVQAEGEGKMVASANLEATAEGSPVTGDIRFYETEKGLQAVVEVSGVVKPGKHGIHIHEFGNCEDSGNAAGSHYNPHGVKHGHVEHDGLEGAHLGDMGNIEIDENGSGKLTVDMPGSSVFGENGIENHAVILHEDEDAFVQPTGNAGGRIACGVIEANNDVMGDKEAAEE